MKRILLLMSSAMLAWMGAFAEDTTDKLYATDVRIDPYDQSLYVNICLEGSRRYIAYGTDILLPTGLVAVSKSNGTPNVVMIDDEYQIDEDIIYPYEEGRRGNTYYHTVYSAFPYDNKHHVRVGCLFTQEEYFTAESGALFRIYVESEYAEGSWPIGAIKVYDAELNTIEQPYDAPVTETIVPLHTGETTLPLKVSSAAKWSTCILPFAADIPTGVTAYTCSRNDTEYIYLEKAESFAAYTPYILYAENGFDGNVNGTVDETIPAAATTGVVTSGYLNGAIVPQTAKTGYVLQNHDGDVKFYAIANDDAFAIPAGKCWMNIPAGSSNVLGFRTDDMTEGINNITIPTSSLSFDLNGRQLKMDKGVYIKNGKKTLSL